jgi:hypothetical protein
MTVDTAAATRATETAISLRDSMSSNDWVAEGLSGGGMAALDAKIRPVDDLSSAGQGWLVGYVQPLQDVVDRMAGKSSVIQTFADGWQRVASAVDALQQQLGQAVPADTSGWQGTAGESYRARATEISTALRGVAALSAATGTAARIMGEATANARQSAGDLVADLVRRLISYVSQAKATEGGVTSNVLSQATALINSYRSPISDIEQRLQQTISHAERQLNGTVAVASLAGAGAGAAILSTWLSLKERLDRDITQVQQIIQLPPPTLPPDARPLSKAELDRIAQNPIFYGKLGYKVTIGEYAEDAALRAMGRDKNNAKFYPYDNALNPFDQRKHVIPDAVSNVNTLIINPGGSLETHVLPNGFMIDVKATSSPIKLPPGDEQFQKYVDYLSKTYNEGVANDPGIPKPVLLYTGTTETQIDDRALAYADRNNVEIWRSQMYLSGPANDPHISVGPAAPQNDIARQSDSGFTMPRQSGPVPLFNSTYDQLLRRKLLDEEEN